MINNIQSIALDKLVAHPDNPNRMSGSNFAKLVRNIERTGRYEPLVVRPCPPVTPAKAGVQETCEGMDSCLRRNDKGVDSCLRRNDKGVAFSAGLQSRPDASRGDAVKETGVFQIINGYHRWKALKQLGYKKADVIVWDVDDEQTDILLATLNRLGGSDVLAKKLALLKKLSSKINARELSKLLPNSAAQIKRLTGMKMPKVPAKAASENLPNPVVFFLNDKQQQIVEEALSLAEHPGDVTPAKGPGVRASQSVTPAKGSGVRGSQSIAPAKGPGVRGSQSVTPAKGPGVRASQSVTPAKAGVQEACQEVDSRFCGNDKGCGNDKKQTKAARKAAALTTITRHFINTTNQEHTGK